MNEKGLKLNIWQSLFTNAEDLVLVNLIAYLSKYGRFGVYVSNHGLFNVFEPELRDQSTQIIVLSSTPLLN
jgi:hypothetical protein